MKKLAKVAVVLFVLLAGFLVFVATRPDHFSLARSTDINAAPDKIYPLIADFHGWLKWSPWDKLDPKMTRTYEGEPGTVGHSYAWQGNKDVGRGRMTMTELKPGELVRLKLEFIEPFPQTNETRFSFVTNGGKTQVFWTMEGDSHGLLEKTMTLFMDRMVGPSFEEGLAAMKRAAEIP